MYEHQTCTNVLLRTWRFYFVKEGKTMDKICPCPSVIKVVMVTKVRQRILGLPGGTGISLKAASEKGQEMVSGNTCNLV